MDYYTQQRPLPVVGGNIVISRGFNDADDAAASTTTAEGLQAANAPFLLRYLIFLYVLLGFWVLYLMIPRGIRQLCCSCGRRKNVHPFDRNRMVRGWLFSLVRGPSQPGRRKKRESSPPPINILNVSLPQHILPKQHPLDHIHAALEEAECKHEEQLAQERTQRQLHRRVAEASYHAIEEAHSDHSQQLRREREERERRRKEEEQEQRLKAAALQAANESVDAVFVVGSDSGNGDNSYHTDAESTVTMSLLHQESKETDPSESTQDHNLLCAPPTADATIEGASTIAGSISLPAPATTTATLRHHHDMSPSSLSLNSYAHYNPLANHHPSRYPPHRRPLPSTTETSTVAPSDVATATGGGDGLSAFAMPSLEDAIPEDEQLVTTTSARPRHQPTSVRYPIQDDNDTAKPATTLLDIHPNAGKHPSDSHRVPGLRVLQETEVRLCGDGVRLTAHGVKVAAKQVWIRVEESILLWQTERLIQGPGNTSSYIWARGPWRELPLASVLYIDVGKRTTALQYLPALIPAEQCFSLLTSGGSLDLQAHSKLERDAIVACLIVRMDGQNLQWRALYEESSHGAMSNVDF